jgi:hypothetical protein
MSINPARIQYVCSDKACCEQTETPFMVEFPPEALLDEKNIATLFCSRCSKKMIQAEPRLNHNNKDK